MRIAVVAECFLPQTNGVTVTLLHLLDFLVARGDDVLVLAPTPGRGRAFDSAYGAVPVRRFLSVPLPGYPDMRLSQPRISTLEDHLRHFAPDVVHLAAPFVLGWPAVGAAQRLGLPVVAVYQTEAPTYVRRYGARPIEPLMWKRVTGIHSRATLSLAPSSFASQQLIDRGVHRVSVWAHGVDRVFSPSQRSMALHERWAPGGEVVVGYVGRLAREKQVEDLRELSSVAGIQLVVIGDGPRSHAVRRALPGAHFTGHLSGERLHEAMATLDVFVHTGEMDTFAQTIQEAQASGVPAVAPARGGPIDLIRNGETGFLFRPGDLRGLRGAVELLVRDPELRARLGEQARVGTLARTWDAVNTEVTGHYARAIALGAQDRANGTVRQWRRLPRIPRPLRRLRADPPARTA